MSHSATVVSIVGARPQFVKAAGVSPALRAAGLHEILIHTGQHYDWAMSEVFFEGLGLPAPDVNLQIGSGPHGAQTGRMLEAIEKVLSDTRPAMVIVFGDTNSTLAGALAATKLMMPVAHVEAGLRSFDRTTPEEINRVLTDHLSAVLFAPTVAAVGNLAREGITDTVVRTGDVMLDVVERHRLEITAMVGKVCREFGVGAHGFAFATVHRAENTDNGARWAGILAAFAEIGRQIPVVWAAHPRTRDTIRGLDLPGVMIVSPLPYLQTQALISAARVVLTDSGGLQKEAAFHRIPCVTLRDRTEWVELVDAGVNVIAGADCDRIVAATQHAFWPESGVPSRLYGNGDTAVQIAAAVAALVNQRTLNTRSDATCARQVPQRV
jgi:UDP-N-acetylglucosamine 2-epimerase